MPLTAVARRREGYTHEVKIRDFTIVADEPPESGGSNEGPRPTELLLGSLASCTAITIEMYARRKEWELGDVEVEATFHQEDREAPPRYAVTLRLSPELDEEQAERLRVIAGKCPVHRVLCSKNVEVADIVERLGG